MKLDKSKFINDLKSYLKDDNKTNVFCNILHKNKAIVAGGSVLSSYYKDSSGIRDIDIYVNKKNCHNLYKDLKNLYRYFSISEMNTRVEKERSFFRKNNILGRFVFSVHKIEFDIIIVQDDTKVENVVSNFDLSFCEIWFDGKNVYANHKDDVLNKIGILKDDYIDLLFVDKNRFTDNRIKKYFGRGFEIYIPKNYKCKIESKLKIIPEQYYCSFLYTHIVNNYHVKPGVLYLPLKKYSFNEVFKYLIFENGKFFKYKVNNNKYNNILKKYHKIIKPIYIKQLKLYNDNIGKKESKRSKGVYNIYVNKKFVRESQYKPVAFYKKESKTFKSDKKLKNIIKKFPKTKIVCSCPNGHMYYDEEIIKKCNICECIIGIYNNMLVPGNHIVYIKNLYNINYGNFPINDKKNYLKIKNQFDIINKNLDLF